MYETVFIRYISRSNRIWHTCHCLCVENRGHIVSYINTITMGDTDIEVYGTECSAEPDVGLMSDYVEIEDLKIGGVSVYEMFASYGLLDKAQEYINDAWGG